MTNYNLSDNDNHMTHYLLADFNEGELSAGRSELESLDSVVARAR